MVMQLIPPEGGLDSPPWEASPELEALGDDREDIPITKGDM